MWISEPIPVMTRIISDDRLSSRSPNGNESSPEVIHWNAFCSIAWCELTTVQTEATDTPKAAITAAQAMPPDTDFDSRRPKKALTRNPRNGMSGISSNIEDSPSPTI